MLVVIFMGYFLVINHGIICRHRETLLLETATAFLMRRGKTTFVRKLNKI